MEITTCIEVIISIDAWNFCTPSMQWKFSLDTWRHFHGRLWFHELFFQCTRILPILGYCNYWDIAYTQILQLLGYCVYSDMTITGILHIL